MARFLVTAHGPKEDFSKEPVSKQRDVFISMLREIEGTMNACQLVLGSQSAENRTFEVRGSQAGVEHLQAEHPTVIASVEAIADEIEQQAIIPLEKRRTAEHRHSINA